jgi:cysteine desulfurase
MRTYLDHNATSPLRPQARDAIVAALELYGNASSVHGEGRKARALIERSRETIARALGTIAPTVVFTSGGSESCNMGLRGAGADRIIVSRPSNTRACWKRLAPAASRFRSSRSMQTG